MPTGGSLRLSSQRRPRRYIQPAPYGIYNVLRQLDALIEIESATVQEADELRRLERELHEDLIEYEFQRIERENARLYGGSYVPPRVCEPGRFIPETL